MKFWWQQQSSGNRNTAGVLGAKEGRRRWNLKAMDEGEARGSRYTRTETGDAWVSG